MIQCLSLAVPNTDYKIAAYFPSLLRVCVLSDLLLN